jgi:hypothetical protein
MSSQILGNLITTFVLGLISNVTYFLVLTILGCIYIIIKLAVRCCSCFFLMSKKLIRVEIFL